MTYIIVQPCIETKDASCVDVCPVEAIFPDDEVPEQWQEFIAKNYENFSVPAP
jgi:Fe-S-cluster-containing hydrogenase component 2